MNPIQQILVNKSSTIFDHSYTIPTVCIARESTFDISGIGLKKTQWLTKYFGYTTPTSHFLSDAQLTDYAMSGSNSSYSAMYTINGVLTAATQEGIYYMMFRGSTQSYKSPKSNMYKCDYNDYGYFYNRMSEVSLRRFESTIRIKFVIDDISVSPPLNIQNIPDMYPTGGMRY